MSRSDNDRLGDIIFAGQRLAEIVARGRAAYDQEWPLRDASAFHTANIADAYSHLSADTRRKLGNAPIKEITGMRVRPCPHVLADRL